MQFASEYRKDYSVSLYEFPKKVGKLLNRIENEGYYAYIIYDEANEINSINIIEKIQ